MSVTQLYNKILLREHPDLSPVADATFQKAHSFIFPGDEIVMCSKISSSDFGGIAGVTPTSVKMSIIAKKPNIFSEEFSREFAATRSFELDSVIVPFDTFNAPVVPWGVAGADGYAPNINFTQDRNWALPIGDFRRQIKAFTDHTNGTSVWDYNFWFPFIFDERYWLALAAADNDFYDTGEPQNGKNQKWLRYHDPSAPPFGWKIFMKIEFNYTKLVSGGGGGGLGAGFLIGGSTIPVPYTLVSEYSLSNEQTGIQDYESNPDYALLEIKTGRVGETPSTDRYIFGSENTSCFAYFTKQTAWDVGEKSNLSAVFRIRPTEGGDRLGSRASSQYPITVDVVWTGINNDLLTDTDVNITTDTADNIILDNAGAGVLIDFDLLDDKKITVQAEIDYNKLAAIYPGVTNFTLYCRLYNGTKLIDDVASS